MVWHEYTFPCTKNLHVDSQLYNLLVYLFLSEKHDWNDQWSNSESEGPKIQMIHHSLSHCHFSSLHSIHTQAMSCAIITMQLTHCNWSGVQSTISVIFQIVTFWTDFHLQPLCMLILSWKFAYWVFKEYYTELWIFNKIELSLTTGDQIQTKVWQPLSKDDVFIPYKLKSMPWHGSLASSWLMTHTSSMNFSLLGAVPPNPCHCMLTHPL
jgi:hypothetical protein